MHYTFETSYNQETLSVMAKCLRKTVRKTRSRKSHIFGWFVVVLAVVLPFISGEEGFVINFKTIITWTAGIAIVIALLFEDRLNGYFARKRMLKGTEKAVSIFDTENIVTFSSETAIGKSEFAYDKIAAVAETNDYFVFVFSENHAQVYNKRSMTGGTVDEFRCFISEVTAKAIVTVA